MYSRVIWITHSRASGWEARTLGITMVRRYTAGAYEPTVRFRSTIPNNRLLASQPLRDHHCAGPCDCGLHPARADPPLLSETPRRDLDRVRYALVRPLRRRW